MCICKESTEYLPGRVDSIDPPSNRRDKTLNPRRAFTINQNRMFTSFTFVIFAMSCLVGSEHEQIKTLRQSSQGYNVLGQSLLRMFRSFYRTHSNDFKEPLLTDDQVNTYARDGFIVLSGLLDDSELASLVDAGESLVTKHVEKMGGKLKSGNFQVHEFGLVFDENDKRFRDVALRSRLPRAAAELMNLDGHSQNLRLLRDVFLAKGQDSTSSCGWHIDDQMFWPASYKLPTTNTVDQSGINAWIALDDMPFGGSMAVSPFSHTQYFSWKNEAYHALNFKDQYGNGIAKDDLFEMIRAGTVDSCGLEKFAPQVYDEIELSKQEFSFKRGDVIFMNRWLFHKSTDLTENGRLALQAIENSLGDNAGAALLKRYSLRFATGSTSLPGGFMTEKSVLASDGNLGKQLDDIEGEWYPKCWPEVDHDVDTKIETVVREQVPVANEKLAAIMAEVMSLFAKSK